MSVCDDDLAVVAEVDPEGSEKREHRPGTIEAADVNPDPFQSVKVAVRQIGGSDVVIEKQHGDPGARLLDQQVGQLPANCVIADDVELQEHIVLRGANSGEDGIVGRAPVDQELHFVAAQKRQLRDVDQQRPCVGGLVGAVDDTQLRIIGFLASCGL
ncbi:hypothetical protein [Breoghania sp.]|uniref:hypothetical protein n=1 Tax=Breoghania sp. TaxID=2065378 RepID=UPI002624A012|nr:hypothetical protein [Breoghania sp.]MDJ0929717.1 hypothetical protein [Breoghania sp.]